MADQELPDPDGEEIASLLSSNAQRLVYGLLYRRQSSPPTLAELRMFAADALGEDQAQIDQRVRELRRFFDIVDDAAGDRRGFRLLGWSAKRPTGSSDKVSRRRRAEILAPQRCAQCGRTPLEDQVKLDIDFKIPREWDGSSEPENLQPLCEDCLIGKRDYFSSFDERADKIRQAINYDEPQRRIGELLKAFNGEWVRTDLLSIVASSKEYQEDWQRRLRDLRYLGWVIKHQNRHNEGARVWAYYRVVKSAAWPDHIHAAIVAEEKRRKLSKKQRSS